MPKQSPHTIAIIRGSSLNFWEMQNFSPLTESFSIFALAPYHTVYDTQEIGLSVKHCRTVSQYYHRLGRGKGILHRFKPLERFNSDRFLGLEKSLRNVDLVHTVGIAEVFNGQLAELKKKMGFRIVSTIWENIPYLWDGVGTNSPKVHQRKRQVISAFDYYIAITKRAKASLFLEGADSNKITIQPMGINLERFRPQKKNTNFLGKYELTEQDTIILSIANLSGNKGIRELIFAAARLKQQGVVDRHKLKFIVAGGGDYRKMLENLIDRACVNDIFRLIGQVPYADIPAIHNLADIFYLGSLPTEIWQEQFGMVLIESMACGKAGLVANSGSIAEVVGDAAVLFPAGDFFRLSIEIEQLAKDINLRAELGRRGYNRARDLYDSQKVAEKIGNVYNMVLNKG
ncbi:glycosyltransferase family 4 protein [Patescibacteria group bacterium]|nr:glycosyltransferase family 4 protein [Patescibacteria group bacterium]